MATIYKTTERVGKRPIFSSAKSTEELLAVIKRTADHMGWEYTATERAVIIKFKKGEKSATYSVEENNSYLCAEPDE